MGGCLFRCDAALVDQRLHPRVVVGELFQFAVAQQVAARVADVRDAQHRAREGGTREGGAHPVQFQVVLDQVGELVVGALHDTRHVLHEMFVVEATVSLAGLLRGDGGGQVPGGSAPHAVGDDQQVGAGEGRVLVVLADPSHLGVDAEVEGEHRPHTSSFIMVRPMRRMSFTPIGVGSVMRLPFK